jgi:hypothetical protein
VSKRAREFDFLVEFSFQDFIPKCFQHATWHDEEVDEEVKII